MVGKLEKANIKTVIKVERERERKEERKREIRGVECV